MHLISGYDFRNILTFEGIIMKKFDINKLTSEDKDEKVYSVPANPGLCVKVYRSGRKKFYYRHVYAPGRSKYIPIGVYPIYCIDTDREKMLQIKRSIEFGEFISKDADVRFVDVMKKAIEAHLSSQQSKSTTSRTYRTRSNQLVQFFKNSKLTDVKAQDIRDVYNKFEREAKLATLKRIHQIMGIVYQYAIKEGYIAAHQNPLTEVNYEGNYKKYSKKNVRHHEKLTDVCNLSDFLRSVCAQKDEKLHYIMATIFMCLTGMRIDSVIKLKWKYFDENFSRMQYPKTVLKGEKMTEPSREDLLLPMSPILQELMEKYRKTVNPFASYRRGEYVFMGLRGRASIDGLRTFVKEMSGQKITPHGLRGTFTTWAKKKHSVHGVLPLFIRMYLHQTPTEDEIAGAYTDVHYTDVHYTDVEIQEQLLKLGAWYSEFLRSQFDYVTPILEKLYI